MSNTLVAQIHFDKCFPGETELSKEKNMVVFCLFISLAVDDW